MLKTSVLYKTLVVGVIVLFIGIGVQPAIAVTPDTSDNDDCNLCPKKVSKSHLVLIQSLLGRLDTLNTKLSIVSKLNPDIEVKYQELSKRIPNHMILNEDSRICEILENILFPFFNLTVNIMGFIVVLFAKLGFSIIVNLIIILANIYSVLQSPFFFLWYLLCYLHLI